MHTLGVHTVEHSGAQRSSTILIGAPITAVDSSFDLFSLTAEHHDLRSAIRALTERDIAPYAADCDERERFPQEALDALMVLSRKIKVDAGPSRPARGVAPSDCCSVAPIFERLGVNPRRTHHALLYRRDDPIWRHAVEHLCSPTRDRQPK